MKHILLTFICIHFSYSFTQNLVLNPSFETRTGCPNGISDYSLVSNWTNWNNSTPDYFNSCATGLSNVDVPSNFGGSQTARTGSAYVGIVSQTMSSPYQSFDETIRAALSSSLVAGQSYTLTFYVNLADNSPYTVYNFKAVFSSGTLASSSGTQGFPPGNELELAYTGAFYSNTTAWEAITMCYTAVGGENAVTIGYGNGFVSSTGQSSFVIGNYPYYYIDDVSLVASTPCITPLPIELLSFTANCHGNDIQFDWTTESELNNDFFTLEKSTTGQEWKKVLQIPTQNGNTAVKQDYNYSHRTNDFGLTYYRLSQTDLDGTTTYFEPISVQCEPSELIAVPNPATDFVAISWDRLNEITSIDCYDATGRFMQSFSVSEIETGILNMDYMENGSYTLVIKTKVEAHTIRLIKH